MTPAKKSTAKDEQTKLFEYTGSQVLYYPAYGVVAQPGMDPVEFDPADPDLPVPPDSNWMAFSGKMDTSGKTEPKDS